MPFYLRRGKNFGPLRFNFSKGGIGVSAGVKGARIGVGPHRGPYVHVGRQGIYYRKTLGKPVGSKQHRASFPPPIETLNANHDDGPSISHATISQDIGADRGLSPWFFVVLGAGVIMLLAGQWLIGIVLLAVSLLFPGVVRGGRGIEVTYALDEDGQERHHALAHIVNNLAPPTKVWLVTEARSQDWKRGGGAATGVRRTPMTVGTVRIVGHRTNIQIPGLQGRGATIGFLPDAIYLQTRDQTVSADYSDLALECGTVSYVEDEAIPPGAKQIGETWQFVNRDGSRDRRFTHNRKLPVLEYGTITITAEPNFTLELQVSTREASQEFREDLAHYCKATRDQEAPAPETPAEGPAHKGPHTAPNNPVPEEQQEPRRTDVPGTKGIPDAIPEAVKSVLAEIAADTVGDEQFSKPVDAKLQEILELFDLLVPAERQACVTDTYRVCRDWAQQLLGPANACTAALAEAFGPEMADNGLDQLIDTLIAHEPTPENGTNALRTAIMAIYLEKRVLELASPLVNDDFELLKTVSSTYHHLKAQQVEAERTARAHHGFLQSAYLATYFASPVTDVIDNALWTNAAPGKRDFLRQEIRRSASWAASLLNEYRRYIKSGPDRLIQSDIQAARAALDSWDEEELSFQYQQIRDTPYVMMGVIARNNPSWNPTSPTQTGR